MRQQKGRQGGGQERREDQAYIFYICVCRGATPESDRCLAGGLQQENPDVEIEILGAGYDGYWDNITTEILANNESDMIQVYPENISTYHAIREDGTFIDLSDYMSDELKGKLVGQDMCDVNGETLAISSYAWGTTGIFYRNPCLRMQGSIQSLSRHRKISVRHAQSSRKDGKYAMGVVSGTHAFTVSEWSRSDRKAGIRRTVLPERRVRAIYGGQCQCQCA